MRKRGAMKNAYCTQKMEMLKFISIVIIPGIYSKTLTISPCCRSFVETLPTFERKFFISPHRFQYVNENRKICVQIEATSLKNQYSPYDHLLAYQSKFHYWYQIHYFLSLCINGVWSSKPKQMKKKNAVAGSIKILNRISLALI